MTGWILAALALLVVQTLLPPAIRYVANGRPLRANLGHALGPRDEPLPTVAAAERAVRALANLMETLPVFLTLAILVLVLEADGPTARIGAGIYVVGRAVYVPCYVWGIYMLRSVIWAAAGIGLVVLAAAVVPLA